MQWEIRWDIIGMFLHSRHNLLRKLFQYNFSFCSYTWNKDSYQLSPYNNKKVISISSDGQKQIEPIKL